MQQTAPKGYHILHRISSIFYGCQSDLLADFIVVFDAAIFQLGL
jgi:hypothetical protein